MHLEPAAGGVRGGIAMREPDARTDSTVPYEGPCVGWAP